ncbi:Uncharacterised protein [Vibrio cholerae]|nr:Uncharacterised protein [Vibrio cholerae]
MCDRVAIRKQNVLLDQCDAFPLMDDFAHGVCLVKIKR